MPASGLRLGRGSAQFRMVALGGSVVGTLRYDISGSDDAQWVHLYEDASVSGVTMQRRGLGCVLPVLDSIARHGPSHTRSLELAAQWNAVGSAGPCGPLSRADLAISPGMGLPVFGACVKPLYDSVVAFIHRVVVHRKDVAVRNWRTWVLEDLQVHLYRWLRSDLVAPAPFLSCDPGITEDGSGILSDPGRIDEQFRKAWLPFFCRAGRGSVDLSAFNAQVGGWLPSLDEVDFPPLLGSERYDVVQHKKAYCW